MWNYRIKNIKKYNLDHKITQYKVVSCMKYQHYDKNIKKNIPFEDKHDKMILV